MLYVGMDVHQKNTVFCVLDPAAAAARAYRTVTRPTTEDSFRDVLGPLGGRCKVAYEVGTQAQWVARVVRPLAVEVQVANPSRVPWLFRDGHKHDRLDAKKLAILLYWGQLPTVHLPSADVSAWRALINHRRTLVKRRTMTKNQVRTILRAFVLKCPYRSCWTQRGVAWLRSQTFDAARDLMMETLLAELAATDERIAKIEKQLDAIAAAQPKVALLRTIRGVGPRTAEAVVAFADVIGRFRHSKQFSSYFGMVPALDASAGVCRLGHITKRGPSVVRWVLVEAVHQVVRRCPPFREMLSRIHRGKKERYKKAVVAVGRKLLTIMFAMLRDGSAFDSRKMMHQAA
jgi:transposase